MWIWPRSCTQGRAADTSQQRERERLLGESSEHQPGSDTATAASGGGAQQTQSASRRKASGQMLAWQSQCLEALCTSRADAPESEGRWNPTARSMSSSHISCGIVTSTWASGAKFHSFTRYWRHPVPLSLWKWGGDMPFSTLDYIWEAQRTQGDLNTWAAKQENARENDLGQVTTFSGSPFPHLSNEELENLPDSSQRNIPCCRTNYTYHLWPSLLTSS